MGKGGGYFKVGVGSFGVSMEDETREGLGGKMLRKMSSGRYVYKVRAFTQYF